MTTLLRRVPAATGRAARGPRPRPPWRRCIAIDTRTYDDALQLLDTFQSNTAAKALFGAPHAHPHPTAHAHPPPSPSLNARAIPEMLAWLAHAGIPRALPLRAIHIAGTKGKGSTAAYATEILRSAGRRVGTYTSPHLVTVRERICINGVPLRRDLFAQYFFEVYDAIGIAPALDPGGGGEVGEDGLVRPFYFRFLTILALKVFLAEGVHNAVIECGIGGEYDATNVLPASCISASVITHLERDHVAMLGDSIEDIAWHKAGIFKRGVPAVTRPQGDRVMGVLRARAEERGAKLVEVTDEDADRWSSRGAGPFDRENRALAAVAAGCHLQGHKPRLVEGGWIDKATRRAKLPGRCQVLRRGRTTFFLDGAHTPDSIAQIGAWFAAQSSRSSRRVLLFNQQERDAAPLLEALVGSFAPNTFSHAVFCRNQVGGKGKGEGEGEADLTVQRALAERMQWISPRTRVVVVGDLKEAVGRVKGDVLVTGSMYLVGGVLRVLGEGE